MNYKEKIEAKETYTYRAVCTNCGNRELIEIPKGITIEQYLSGRGCDNCGCNTYR